MLAARVAPWRSAGAAGTAGSRHVQAAQEINRPHIIAVAAGSAFVAVGSVPVVVARVVRLDPFFTVGASTAVAAVAAVAADARRRARSAVATSAALPAMRITAHVERAGSRIAAVHAIPRIAAGGDEFAASRHDKRPAGQHAEAGVASAPSAGVAAVDSERGAFFNVEDNSRAAGHTKTRPGAGVRQRQVGLHLVHGVVRELPAGVARAERVDGSKPRPRRGGREKRQRDHKERRPSAPNGCPLAQDRFLSMHAKLSTPQT